MHAQAHIHRVRSADIESIAAEVHGWQGSWLQLDRGHLDYGVLQLAVAGVEVNRHAVDRRLLGRWYHDGPAVSLIWLDGADEPLQYAGRDLRRHEAILTMSGREHWLRIPRGGRLWEVLVTPEAMRLRGWHVPPEPVVTLTPRQRRALARTTHEQSAAVAAAPETTATIARDRILDVLEDIFPDALCPPVPHEVVGDDAGGALIRSAAEWMAAQPIVSAIRVPTMARELGVSERTLYKHFRQRVGMGPYEFERLVRLHGVRRALARAPRGRGTVQRAAAASGFADARGMARAYRAHFGESPRETARRWACRI